MTNYHTLVKTLIVTKREILSLTSACLCCDRYKVLQISPLTAQLTLNAPSGVFRTWLHLLLSYFASIDAKTKLKRILNTLVKISVCVCIIKCECVCAIVWAMKADTSHYLSLENHINHIYESIMCWVLRRMDWWHYNLFKLFCKPMMSWVNRKIGILYGSHKKTTDNASQLLFLLFSIVFRL